MPRVLRGVVRSKAWEAPAEVSALVRTPVHGAAGTGDARSATVAVGHGTVDVVLEAIGEALAKEETVRIAGFGTFAAKSRAARTGRNPRTGESVPIPASKLPAFKPAKALRDVVNGRRDATVGTRRSGRGVVAELRPFGSGSRVTPCPGCRGGAVPARVR